jgi:carnitine O-acetyltransferase
MQTNDKQQPQPQFLCSSQYKYLFQTSRLPGEKQDTNLIYTPVHGYYLQRPFRAFAIVAVRGQFYELRLTNPFDHSIFPMEKIKDALLHKCQNQNAPALGYCTTQTRNLWYHDYAEIVSMPRLKEHVPTKHPSWPIVHLETIRDKDEPLIPLSMTEAFDMLQSALVVLCLDVDKKFDDNNPRELASHLWHGHGTGNRWYDKSIQLVITGDASLGLIGEHSMADGGTAMELAEYIQKQPYRETAFPEVDEVYVADDPAQLYRQRIPAGTRFVFERAALELSEEDRLKVEQRVSNAKSTFAEMIQHFDLQWLEYTKYGNAAIKTFGFSPDSLVQMAMQLAAYRYFGGITVATYESAQTRKFRHGRTETIRTVTPDSQAFCKAMTEERSSGDTCCLSLLRQACLTHTKFARRAVNGKGVDRHFLGLLNCRRKGEPLPDLFQHPVFLRSKRWRLSTSNVPNMAPGFAFTEEDGFGIGYDIRKDRIIFTITCNSMHNDADKFSTAISTALDDVFDIVQDVSSS